MRKSQREAIRANADLRKQNASERKRQSQEYQQERQAAIARAFEAPSSAEQRLLRDLKPKARELIEGLLRSHQTLRKLVIPENRAALARLGETTHLRSFADWEPAGKGRETLFRSLCHHLLAKYPTPPFLWSAFHESEDTAKVLVPLVVHVAGGGSLYQYCRDGGLPFSLTRAQCAELMKTEASYGVLDALRRVQVKTEGGDRHLFEVWRHLPRIRELQSPAMEAFGLSVLRFLARNPMLSREQIAPVCDYVYHRQRGNPVAFSMQGRTVAALLRDMRAWHAELNSWRVDANRPPVIFERSGFRAYRVEKSDDKAPLGKNGFGASRVWTVSEVLSSNALKEEGRVMHHCVYSYRDQIEQGHTSIWTLVMDDGFQPEKVVTLEVHNPSKAVVQARGKHNRKTTSQEDRIILEWARSNQLILQYGKQW